MRNETTLLVEHEFNSVRELLDFLNRQFDNKATYIKFKS